MHPSIWISISNPKVVSMDKKSELVLTGNVQISLNFIILENSLNNLVKYKNKKVVVINRRERIN